MRKDEFKAGDSVWCMIYGKGIVYTVSDNEEYPVVVTFGEGIGIERTYTTDGRCHINLNRTLFFEEVKIPASAYIKPKWRANFQEGYYYVTDTGDCQYYRDGYSREDGNRFRCGNYFKTAKEAQDSKFYKAFYE